MLKHAPTLAIVAVDTEEIEPPQVWKQKKADDFLLKFWDLSGAKQCKSCRSRKMLQNAPTLAIVAVDTAENEPLQVLGGNSIQYSILS